MKNNFITIRIEGTFKELLINEARKRNKSLSELLRYYIKKHLYDKYKSEKASKGV